MDGKKWRFSTPYGLMGRKSLNLEEDIDFLPEKQQKWFFGYTTVKNGITEMLWGKKIDFYLDVRPWWKWLPKSCKSTSLPIWRR